MNKAPVVKPTKTEQKNVVKSFDSAALGLAHYMEDLLSERLPTASDQTADLLLSEMKDRLQRDVKPPDDGELSEWILRINNVEYETAAEFAKSYLRLFKAIVSRKLYSGFWRTSLTGVNLHEVRRLLPQIRNGDFSDIDIETIVQQLPFSKIAEHLNVPGKFEINSDTNFPIRIDARMFRVLRASFRCILQYQQHPIRLIASARTGDLDAALKLIHVDRMFLEDSCTQKARRDAIRTNEAAFAEELSKALNKPFHTNKKRLIRFALYVLFACGIKGSWNELQRLFDPDGTEFPGDTSFERFMQRCRNDFESSMQA